MRPSSTWIRSLAAVAALAGFAEEARAQDVLQIQGATCSAPSILRCPESECSAATLIHPGVVVEMKTRRTYYLDYPCDLKRGEKVTFVLSLHGAGSYGNWQRHYFPLVDYKEKYRLVIATPSSPTRAWGDADDEYLKNIVEFVIGQIGRENIAAFWLAGHSQGGMTSNRLVRTEFFENKVDGWLSLSGGRLGGSPGRPTSSGPGPGPGPASGAAANTPNVSAAAPGAARAASAPRLRELPALDMSFIFTTGQREMDEKGLPQSSAWATRYGCGAQSAPLEIVDTKAGYVYDAGRLNQMRPAWGLLPGPGKAALYTYPGCKDGRVVADVVRIDKGHTEGLEPKVTEELIKLMLSAPGGKLQRGK